MDWSSRYVHYPQGASLRALALSQRDPRAYWNYLNVTNRMDATQFEETVHKDQPPRRRWRHFNRNVDWSIALGPNGMAANQYPAKYSFNVNSAPDCTNDFVVFTINSVPSATQANIAAFNNLYSGTAGGNGLCGTGSASTYWAYQISNKALPTSPSLSLDGKKIAFVDGANPAVFHVLTWTAGQGTITAPATPTAAQLSSLTLTAATSANTSSPFIDYFNDIAYVGTDNGNVYKIHPVFSGTPAIVGGAALVTGLGANLTSPVIDFKSGNIFVGNAGGQLVGFTAAGAAIASSPLTVGSGAAEGGIVDPPLVDTINGLIYAATGEDSTRAIALAVQTSTSSFASAVTTPIGNKNQANIHSPAFNAPYLSGNANLPGTTKEWFLYVCGVAVQPGKTPTLYRVGFTGTPPVMNSAVNATSVSLSANNGEQCSPLTELSNGVDRLFLGLETSAVVEYFDISTTTTPTLGAPGQVSIAGGTTGIIVDNVSNANQASSIYLGTLNAQICGVGGTARCAVKLTQSGLQ